MKAIACVAPLALAVLFALLPDRASGEIVKRTMYTDANGNDVQQYVFQASRPRYSRPWRGVRYYNLGYRSYYPYVRSWCAPYYAAPHHGFHHRHGYHVYRGGSSIHGVISGGRAHIRVRF